MVFYKRFAYFSLHPVLPYHSHIHELPITSLDDYDHQNLFMNNKSETIKSVFLIKMGSFCSIFYSFLSIPTMSGLRWDHLLTCFNSSVAQFLLYDCFYPIVPIFKFLFTHLGAFRYDLLFTTPSSQVLASIE